MAAEIGPQGQAYEIYLQGQACQVSPGGSAMRAQKDMRPVHGISHSQAHGIAAMALISHMAVLQGFLSAVQVALDGDGSVGDFLQKATRFCNDKLYGTLACTVVCDPRTQKANGAALEGALAEVRGSLANGPLLSSCGQLACALRVADMRPPR